MNAATITFGSKAIDVRPLIRWHAQRPARTSVMKAARIAFRDSVLDCVVMNTSAHGARVHLFEEAKLPETATLTLTDGKTWTVQRRWQDGADAGFEITSAAALPQSP
jgi:hypothetical protein